MRLKKIIPLILIGVWVQWGAIAQTDFETIMGRIYDGFQSSPSTSTLDSQVASLQASINTDGSWPDIVYDDHSQTNWSPGNHISRISTLSKAYSRPESGYYGDVSLKQDIEKAMNYWLGLDPAPYSSNWFFISISIPKDIGNALIALRNAPVGIDSVLEAQMIEWMTKGVSMTVSPGKDGSNLTDIGQHYIMRACLTEDSAVLQHAVTETGNSIKISSGEGIKQDHSYMAHGPQLYTYAYGREYVSGIRNIAVNITGTSYAYPASKIAIFSDFVRKGFIKASRGAYTDFNVFGRSITRSGVGRADVNLIEQVRNFDLPQYNASYDTVISRMRQLEGPDYGVSPEHIHYWKTDYTVHHRPNYMIGLRNVSTRTVKSEMGNGENIKGYYLTEGATYIATEGDEYFGIYPVWDWNKIPGTTVPAITTFPIRSSWGTNPGKSSFVGGVSDGIYGTSVYAMDDYSTKAKKAWFFFDNEVVCLGSNISSTAPQTINTTVNQALLDGNVMVSDGGAGYALSQGNHDFSNGLDWVWHDDVGYVFPDGGNLHLSNQIQTGSWNSINQNQSSATVNKEVFKLWFDHGETPAAADYAYVLLPGKTAGETENYDLSNIAIIANTDSAQVVKHVPLDMMQAVFYQAGDYQFGDLSINVNKPSVVLLKSISSSEIEVFAADPSQGLAGTLRVGLETTSLGNMKMVDLDFPEGEFAGSTVSGTVNLNSPDFEELIAPIELVAIEDAYVRDGTYADTNFPSGNLVVKKDGAGYARESYIKFNLASLPAQLDSVHLRLWVNNTNTTVTNTSWEFYTLNDDGWQETGITWNTKPAADSLLGEVPGTPAGRFIELDVTGAVLEELQSDGMFSLKIISTYQGSTTDAQFASRENSIAEHRPRLVVYKTAIEEGESGSTLAIGDTFVQHTDSNGDASNKNYGAAGFLAVQKGGYQREAYIKFSLDDLQGEVLSASLKMYSLAAASGTSWELYSVEDTWEEGTGNWQGNSSEGLTWSNAPTAGMLLATVQGTSQAGLVIFDVSGYLQQVIGEQDTVAFKIVSTTSGVYTSFASRESSDMAQRPSLDYVLGVEEEIDPSENIAKQTPKNRALLFPNPLEGMGTIKSEKLIRSVVIRDRTGVIIHEDQQVNKYEYSIDLTGWGNGMYYVVIVGDDFIELKKAIKRN